MFDTSKRLALGVALALPVLSVATPAHAGEVDPLPTTPTAPTPTNELTITAAATPTPEVCVAHAQTNDAVKRHEVPNIACFKSFADAMASIGITVGPTDTPDTIITQARAAAASRDAARTTAASATSGTSSGAAVSAQSFTERPLAMHWAGAVGNSESLYITGTDCTGQGINLEGGPWDNKIQSTTPGGCSKVKHYDGGMYTGTSQVTTAATTLLTTLFMKTSSLTYNG